MPQNGIFSLEEQLAPLSFEQLEEIKQALIRQDSGPEKTTQVKDQVQKSLLGAAQGFGQGALAGLRGTPLPQQAPKKEPEDLVAFEKKERAENKTQKQTPVRL